MEVRNCKREEEAAGPSYASGLPLTTPEISENPSERNHQEEEEEAEAETDDDKNGGVVHAFVPAPPVSLKDQIELDKEDESLRRWKEKLLGCLESELDGQMDPEVRFHSIGIVSDDFGEIVTPLPVNQNQIGGTLFTLREGSLYQLKLKFSVLHNIVSGLTYSNTVWKAGLQVDESKGMLGTFAPQKEPYVYALNEETTPSGALARGIYSAKLKFEDDDRRCHLEIKYSFEIKKRS
ncbi:rho GDP-dissociation inhibitor 1-like [Senna tora]|uniref:Rho GDP-dissociation inhibitor 1-like n=1 Tax=Senna tora TaxID=362788 RepID=A0A834SL81_9FABA|nr:rho GDP-dissociation inhibitor 1-like [Senna tora]